MELNLSYATVIKEILSYHPWMQQSSKPFRNSWNDLYFYTYFWLFLTFLLILWLASGYSSSGINHSLYFFFAVLVILWWHLVMGLKAMLAIKCVRWEQLVLFTTIICLLLLRTSVVCWNLSKCVFWLASLLRIWKWFFSVELRVKLKHNLLKLCWLLEILTELFSLR